MPSDAATLFSIARTQLLFNHPFFGVLSLNLGAVEDEAIPTLAVDGRSIFYNPQFFTSLSPELRISAIAHEVMHCVLEHCTRRGDRTPSRWMRAADYADNQILFEAGLPIGKDWLRSDVFQGMSADEIYTHLSEEEDGQNGPLDEIRHPENTAAEEELTVQWKLATVQAAKQTANQGKLPGQLRKLLDDILVPPIPWRDVLARFMAERIKDDYSWRRPNPYYVHSGIYLPVIDGVGMGDVVIALDTSGSVMSVLDEFGSAVKDIVAATRPRRVYLIYCDAAVNRVDVFERGQELSFETVGGGGTDFRPVFSHIKNNSINPACMLYLTDMYGSFPDEKPSYPVLWCTTTDVQGPFGETLRIKS